MHHDLTRFQRLLYWAFVLAFPLALYVANFSPRTGFTDFIYFGETFSGRVMPEVAATPHEVWPGDGYDGEFYAQIALDPLLTSEALPAALDNPVYRARRILMPVLAYLAGLGQPRLVLNAYALLNLVFYLFLAAGLAEFVNPRTVQSFLCALPLFLGTGTLVSLRRSLTDLPSTVLLLWGTWSGSGLFFALSCLCKEAAVINLFPILDPNRTLSTSLKAIIVAVGPLLIWLFYVQLVLGSKGTFMGWQNFGLPVLSALQWAFQWLQGMLAQRDLVRSFTNLAALISVASQSVFLITHRSVKDPIWRLGIPSAVLFWFLGAGVLVEDYAFTRAMLPMTFSFNLLLLDRKERFLRWFIIGNMGLLGGIVGLLTP